MIFWLKKRLIATFSISLSFLIINLEDTNGNTAHFFVVLPERRPVIFPDPGEISMAMQVSPDMLEAIKSRPLFTKSRRSPGQEPVSETSTILIDGSYTTVELIGTIESTDKQIAAFALGGQSTV